MMPCWFNIYLDETFVGERKIRGLSVWPGGALRACLEDAAVTVTYDPIYEIPT